MNATVSTIDNAKSSELGGGFMVSIMLSENSRNIELNANEFKPMSVHWQTNAAFVEL